MTSILDNIPRVSEICDTEKAREGFAVIMTHFTSIVCNSISQEDNLDAKVRIFGFFVMQLKDFIFKTAGTKPSGVGWQAHIDALAEESGCLDREHSFVITEFRESNGKGGYGVQITKREYDQKALDDKMKSMAEDIISKIEKTDGKFADNKDVGKAVKKLMKDSNLSLDDIIGEG
jgi:hypothetical protein